MSSEAVIETQGLTKRYGRTWALRGLDIEVGQGQIYGLLGPNGAGKTTAIRVLTGLIRANGGQARLFGRPASSVPVRKRHSVGVMVEEPAFYGYLSGRDNLELLASLSGGVSRQQIDEVLELVGLVDRSDDRVATYSHGMRRRLYLAQALVPRPELLILDEPASGLDPRGQVEVRNLLRKLNRERSVTVFMSSHLLHEIEELCTHVAVLLNGQIVADGPVEELLGGQQVRLEILTNNNQRALQILRGYHGVEDVRSRRRGVELYCAPQAVADVNEVLVDEGLRVFGLIPHRETLEQLYMRLTEEDEATPTADN